MFQRYDRTVTIWILGLHGYWDLRKVGWLSERNGIFLENFTGEGN